MRPELTADRVAALVPCHREPPAGELLEAIQAHVGTLLVVDDGMEPAAGTELDRLAARLGAGVFHLGRNFGKGFAIKAGIALLASVQPRPAAVLVVDSDGQHPPEAIPEFLAAAAHAELVVGNRFAEGATTMPPLRRLGNRLSSRLISLLTASSVPDGQCGMRLLHGRALQLHFPGGGLESETRHLIDCLRAEIEVAWVPIPAIYEGQPTSFRRVRDSLAVLREAMAT